MDKNDKKNYESIKKIVRNLEPGVYNERRLKEIIEEKGISVHNMNAVLQELAKTPYLQQLSNSNYLRTRR